MSGEMPKFMSVEDLYLFGMRVDKHYKPKVQLGEMNMKETSSEFYKRMYNITRILLKEVCTFTRRLRTFGGMNF